MQCSKHGTCPTTDDEWGFCATTCELTKFHRKRHQEILQKTNSVYYDELLGRNVTCIKNKEFI